MKKYHIKDSKLASSGKQKIEWAGNQMKVLQKIKERFSKDKPLKGITLAACLHVTAETANLMQTLKAGGANLALCASNPLSTQDDVASSLAVDYGVPTYAIKGEDKKTYYQHLNTVLDYKPQITMDDGADLVGLLHSERISNLSEMIGSSEETTTGVIRLRAMLKDKALKIPVIAVNDSLTKHMFDNRYGTGQSTIDGIIRATNILLAGKKFVVCGYGWCGRGLAQRARGMGADVIVTEVDPLRALEAVMDGFIVKTLDKVIEENLTDFIVTVTGDKHVIGKKHFSKMKDGTILANSGHFNIEIDLEALEGMAISKRKVREFIDEYTLKNKRRIYVLGEGRLINLVAAEGHPPDVMDLSFANQALAAEYLVSSKGKLEIGVYRLPDELDKEIAKIKLESMGITLDKLTEEQKEYLQSWNEGT